MTNTLIDHLRSVFSPSAVSELARHLGEATTPTQKALDGLLPAVTTAVINKVSDQQGATQLYQLLSETPVASDPTLTQLVDTDDHRQRAAESGNALLKQLYPDQPNRLAEAVRQYSDLRLESAVTLTGLVMSILMGFLHKQVETRPLTQAQLTALLVGVNDSTRRAIPAAFAALLGWLIGADRPASAIPLRTEAIPADQPNDRPAGAVWWRWLLLGLALLALLFFILRGCQDNKTAQPVNVPPSSASDTIASDLDGNGPGVRVDLDLPGGRKLSVVEHSFTDSLGRYLAATDSRTPRVFTFDNLTFETDSARITAQARPSVDELIQLMQAYPNVEIRIEGNTDSTGDDAINDPLSGERAEAVKQALIRGGIAANRVRTRELGDKKPVASNRTAAGRQMNRRIDVVVTKL